MKKIFAWIILSIFSWTTFAAQLANAQPTGSAPGVTERLTSPPPPAKPAKINTASRSVTLFPPKLDFTDTSDTSISSARVLPEPLVPMDNNISAAENKALANALIAFKNRKDLENVTALTNFIAVYPNSRWRTSLELNLGLLRYDSGYLTEALKYWQSAWDNAKNAKSEGQQEIANAAASYLVLLEARLGKKEELQKHLQLLDKCSIHGSAELRVKQAREGLFCMQHHPDVAYKCGPFALNSLVYLNQKTTARNSLLEKVKSNDKGTNLAQLKDLSTQVGLHYQMAKRTTKSASFIVPSVMHWKTGHFAAIINKRDDRYQVKDPTFGTDGNLWISPQALASETDGYFLIPSGKLPPGWQAVTTKEAKSVWGKGAAGSSDQGKTPAYPKTCPSTNCGCNGMARASVFSMQATLNITDIPLGYKPPVGPQIDFLVNYNYLEGNQPTTFTFTNLGADWSLNWVSYLTVDASRNATVSVRGGGFETYNYVQPDNVTNPYAPNLMSQAILSIPQSGTYNRQLPDGSIEVFNQPDGTGRIFMTQVIDPQGNSAYIQYDSNFRITTITDAIGQASTITYVSNTVGNAGFYKVAQITDPFSRSASFNYDSTTTYLLSITDVIGLVSNFLYDTSSSFITVLTTPYGSTGFYQYTTGTSPYIGTGLRFTFPDGTSSVIENWIGEISQTYFWDREATALYPFDPANQVHTHCQTTQWMLEGNSAPYVEAAVVDYTLPPLENRTTYTYIGQTSTGPHNVVGSSNKPNTVSRITTGSTTQTYQYQYNNFGYVTQSIDPVGRTFTYSYAANNIDLLEKRQTQSGNNDLIGKWIYNNTQHVPNTYIDGSGQQTQYTYNSFGELATLTDANSSVWTWTYDSNGYLTQIDGPLSGSSDITTFTYDGYGRLYTVTDSEGYTLTYSYDNADRLTQITYPDGTYEKVTYDKLDAIMNKDRLGRWTQRSYDSMDQLAFEIDPLSRKTQYSWCACGSLASLTDPAGHTTTWTHDLEGRPTVKTYADSSTLTYTYDTIGRLATRTDALSQVATYTYNLDNTLSQIAYTNTVNPTSTVNFTYDPNYVRMATAQNGWGTFTYTYNPYITDPYATPTTGGGRLASVTNNVISNSAIAYTYDALGRTTNRSINTSSNSITWTYDQISRITAEANQLGTTNYTYVDNTSGSSKGVYRLASTTLPNTQVTNYNWYPNIADQRLQQITNLGHTPSPPTLSSFSYAYDAAGEITQWQQSQNATNTHLTPGYDLASQLTSSPSDSGSTTTTYIGGAVTTGNTLTLTAYDPTLSGGQEAVSYTVIGGDTTTSIATALKNAINADSNLTGIGVSATSSNSVITITSSASHATSFYGTLSSGATETIAIVPSNSKTPTINNYAYTYNSGSNRSTSTIGLTTTTYNYNNVNALTSITGGPTLTYDSNGNLTNDGTNTYAWDAENRLIQITYPGSNNNSQYTYDAFGHCVKIVETTSGTITSTKQFVWCNDQMCEARDASSTITAQYFSQGETISGTDYYYTKDHLGSIREITDSSGTIQSQYSYDPYGQVTKIAGTGPDSDFQYAGYYYHARSGLNLTLNRAYNANLARWINRDPIGELGGVNLYTYVMNSPINLLDPLGLYPPLCPGRDKAEKKLQDFLRKNFPNLTPDEVKRLSKDMLDKLGWPDVKSFGKPPDNAKDMTPDQVEWFRQFAKRLPQDDQPTVNKILPNLPTR